MVAKDLSNEHLRFNRLSDAGVLKTLITRGENNNLFVAMADLWLYAGDGLEGASVSEHLDSARKVGNRFEVAYSREQDIELASPVSFQGVTGSNPLIGHGLAGVVGRHLSRRRQGDKKTSVVSTGHADRCYPVCD